ncbi:hypothetical protein B0H65DRAFT_55992 [Neurospora tetraspora]|uniref:Transmembrane protein n=1 Tax=Neurospora tetraspora TaxID=94610 RepID=A0AAE0JQM2_9PEZI|nr:hypothetical protein B0H65DRAFT_55992 [Neurospora tetraspora]
MDQKSCRCVFSEHHVYLVSRRSWMMVERWRRSIFFVHLLALFLVLLLTGDEDYDWKGCIGLLAGGRFLSLTISFTPLLCAWTDYNAIVQELCIRSNHGSV